MLNGKPLFDDGLARRYPGYPSRWSMCRLYRYTLWRVWDPGEAVCQIIGLNPSTADDVAPDPTVTRCVNFARSWGYGSLCMTNLFAFRATDPRDMKAQDDPDGPMNDYWLRWIARDAAALVVCAWGTHGVYRRRAVEVCGLLHDVRLHCLKITKDGHPWHPLYLRGDCQPVPYQPKD